jgi:hypothetical protein
VWYDAPTDGILLINVKKEPFRPLNLKITAQEREPVITLHDR